MILVIVSFVLGYNNGYSVFITFWLCIEYFMKCSVVKTLWYMDSIFFLLVLCIEYYDCDHIDEICIFACIWKYRMYTCGTIHDEYIYKISAYPKYI